MKDKFGWLLRHYGMQRLVVIALAWPIYYVAWFIVQLTEYGQMGASLPAATRVATGMHDLWFGFWVASVSVPLLWIASYKLPIIEVQWGFRLIAFAWLFDGMVAIVQGCWMLRGESVPTVALVLQAWACGSVLPLLIGFVPWAMLELWGMVSEIPLLKRWAYSGIEEHAEWISPRKLKKQTQPLPRRLSI
ncbi:hypothetical protein [Adhaeretor mobilis]|uniref:Uncharacterized protein n=1 Tax=Adhaeretor mobilis TaxID=1930276 RepID=A0A517MQC4_9BACT|nr:hypothetical protein [Adhaeretor mobilis]QDS97079.1 hypothetical protein HG15A2_03380 [Adhaeretor mobilis]